MMSAHAWLWPSARTAHGTDDLGDVADFDLADGNAAYCGQNMVVQSATKARGRSADPVRRFEGQPLLGDVLEGTSIIE